MTAPPYKYQNLYISSMHSRRQCAKIWTHDQSTSQTSYQQGPSSIGDKQTQGQTEVGQLADSDLCGITRRRDFALCDKYDFLFLFSFFSSSFSFSRSLNWVLFHPLLSAIQKKKNETNFTCTVMHNTAFAAHTNHVRGLCVSRSLNDNAIVLASSSDDGTCKVP